MAAGRWDIEWDRGGTWRVRLSRRTRAGARLPIAGPLILELREVDAASSTPPLLTLTGTVDPNGAAGRIRATRQQMATLPEDRYEHRVLAVEPADQEPMVWLRGYVTLLDTVADGS